MECCFPIKTAVKTATVEEMVAAIVSFCCTRAFRPNISLNQCCFLFHKESISSCILLHAQCPSRGMLVCFAEKKVLGHFWVRHPRRRRSRSQTAPHPPL